MGQFQPKTFEEILTRMVNRVVARTDLTDLNDGSSVKQVLAAAAREDDDQYFQMINLQDLFDLFKARGTDLDARAIEMTAPSGGNLVRQASRRATGQVVFSRTGTTGAVSIPVGTLVQVPATGAQAAIVFETTATGTIPNLGTTSAPVSVRASVAGLTGNVAPDTVKSFGNPPAGVDFVTNPSAFTTGRDRESDDEFRSRIVGYLRGLARCHPSGLEAAVMGLTYTNGKVIRFASIVEDMVNLGNVTLYIDDGAGTVPETPVPIVGEVVLASAVGGEVDLYTSFKPINTALAFTLKINTVAKTLGTHYTLNPAAGHAKLIATAYPSGLTAGDAVTIDYTPHTGLIAMAQRVIDGDPLDRANYPGYRAAGVLVQVKVPTILQAVIQANITVRQGYSQTDVAVKVKTALSAYVNALSVNEDVILSELTERAMTVEGMFDIAFITPTTNLIILDTQLARLSSTNITIN